MFRFPWTNEHELNLDWIIRTVKSLLRRVKTLEESGGGGGGAEPYDSTPAALGAASPGVSDQYARGDHVHPMPTAAAVGAIATPANPASGDFLMYDGNSWSAQTIQTWTGGDY